MLEQQGASERSHLVDKATHQRRKKSKFAQGQTRLILDKTEESLTLSCLKLPI